MIQKSVVKKSVFGFFILVVFVLCSAEWAFAKKPMKLRYFTGMTASHYFCSDLMPFFAKEVDKAAGGSVKIENYPGGQLFGYRDGIDAAKMGAVEMGLTALGFWGGHNPVFSFSDYFLLIDDIDHWLRARDAIHKVLEPLFRKQNIKLLYYSAYGGNGICGKKPINVLEDIKGLKVRAPVPGALTSLSAWGANPVKIASSEVYDAMEKGAIDAFTSSWSSMYSRKYYEVANYAVGPIWWTVWVNFMNLDTWNSLSKEQQDVITAAGEMTEQRSIAVMKAFDKKSLGKLAEVGTIKILSPEEKKIWGQPLKKAYDSWVKKCAEKGFKKEAEKIIQVLEETR